MVRLLMDKTLDPLTILQDARDRAAPATQYGTYSVLAFKILTAAIGHLIGHRYSSVDTVMYDVVAYYD